MIAAAVILYVMAGLAAAISACGFILSLFKSDDKDGAWICVGLLFSFMMGGVSAALCAFAAMAWGAAV